MIYRNNCTTIIMGTVQVIPTEWMTEKVMMITRPRKMTMNMIAKKKSQKNRKKKKKRRRRKQKQKKKKKKKKKKTTKKMKTQNGLWMWRGDFVLNCLVYHYYYLGKIVVVMVND